MTIREIINKFITDFISREELYSLAGTVTEIDEARKTCTVQPVDGAVIYDVRLQGNISLEKTGLIIYPKIDTDVIVTFLNKSTGYVSLVTEIDKIELDVNTTIVINQGENGGLVIIGDLVDKINKIENTVNDLLTSYLAHMHPTAALGPPSPPTPTVPPAPGQITLTVIADIENDKIKQ